MTTTTDVQAALEAELRDAVLAPAPANARGYALPLLAGWLLRAQTCILTPEGLLTAWGGSVVKIALCTMIQVGRDSPSAAFPPDLMEWLGAHLEPNAMEHDVAAMLATVLQRAWGAEKEGKTDVGGPGP